MLLVVPLAKLVADSLAMLVAEPLAIPVAEPLVRPVTEPLAMLLVVLGVVTGAGALLSAGAAGAVLLGNVVVVELDAGVGARLGALVMVIAALLLTALVLLVALAFTALVLAALVLLALLAWA